MRMMVTARTARPPTWRPYVATREEDDDESRNALFGIALACLLSAPVWAALAVVAYRFLP